MNIQIDGKPIYGSDIAQLRNELGLSQQAFANAVGCTRSNVSKVEVEYKYRTTERVQRYYILLLVLYYNKEYYMNTETKKVLRDKVRILEDKVWKLESVIEYRLYNGGLLKQIRDNVKDTRLYHNITIQQAAKRLGVSFNTYRSYENSQNIRKLKKAEDVIMEMAYGGNND